MSELGVNRDERPQADRTPQQVTRRTALQTGAATIGGLAGLSGSADRPLLAQKTAQPAGANPVDPPRFLTMIGNWSGAENIEFLDYVDQINPEALQAGFFGPNVYSLIETDNFKNSFGQPAVKGTRPALAAWRKIIAEAHRRKRKFIGQFAFTMFWGNEETGNGLFDYYNNHWDEKTLGRRPGKSIVDMMQVLPSGKPVIGPDPEQTRLALGNATIPNRYGCFNNPDWRALCKAMVKAAIDIGIDGFMSVFNFRYTCHCGHCQTSFRKYLKDQYSADDLKLRFGIDDIDKHSFKIIPGFTSPDWSPLAVEAHRWTDKSLQAAWHEVFVEYGRSLKPDLILGAWYHCHWLQPGFKPSTDLIKGDERVTLPLKDCAKGASYFWYCMGTSVIRARPEQGSLGDSALESKYMFELAQGRSFIPNKYDAHRPRLTMIEGPAFGGICRGMHWPGGPGAHIPMYQQYYGFLRRNADLYHPVESLAEAALVLPRKASYHGDISALEPIQALGRALLAQHVLFDVVSDEAVSLDRLSKYRLVLCPHVKYLDDTQLAAIQQYLEQGGTVYAIGELATHHFDGRQRRAPKASGAPQPVGRGRFWQQPNPDDLQAHLKTVRNGSRWNVLKTLAVTLSTIDAPWKVQVNAFRQDLPRRVILHLINYDYQEIKGIDAEPTTLAAPANVRLRLPDTKAQVRRVRFLTPEKDAVTLPASTQSGKAIFTPPKFYVYGIAVVEY